MWAIGTERAARAMRGFTLIEILVVAAIAAALAATVVVAFAGAGGERALAREAERARALIAYACERAELAGRDIGLDITPSGYRFSHFDRGMWTQYRSDELRPRQWPKNFVATLALDTRPLTLKADSPDANTDKPLALCYASGELTPFRLELSLPDLARRYRIDGLPDGEVRLATIDAPAR